MPLPTENPVPAPAATDQSFRPAAVAVRESVTALRDLRLPDAIEQLRSAATERDRAYKVFDEACDRGDVDGVAAGLAAVLNCFDEIDAAVDQVRSLNSRNEPPDEGDVDELSEHLAAVADRLL